MKIYLQGEAERLASQIEFYALRFSNDFPPIPVSHDSNGYWIEGTEEHRRRLGAWARPAAEQTKKEKRQAVPV